MKRLLVDYVSDLHLAYYLKVTKSIGFNEEEIKRFIETNIVPKIKGEILVVAGDLSEFIVSNIFFLNECSKYYKKVFYIAGNHEYYLSWIIGIDMLKKYNKISSNKIKEIISLLDGNDKVIFLDSNEPQYHGVYSYDGFTIAGDTLWYYPQNLKDWYFYLLDSNDSHMIKKKNESQIAKIKRMHQKSMHWYETLPEYVDLIATHVPPLHNPHSPKEKNGCYFTPVNTIKTNTWIYGHDHIKASFHENGCRFISNPWGYDSKTFDIETIEIQSSR